MNDVSLYDEAYYSQPQEETWFRQRGLLRPDQLAAICYIFGKPFRGNDAIGWQPSKVVASIGCGAGELEKELERLGLEVIGVDPSPGAKALYRASNLVERYEGGADTLLFVEAIEHLPMSEIKRLWSMLKRDCRVIITNWETKHPITNDQTGWEHITDVDTRFYNELSYGFRVRIRYGSHLVLEKW